jgi:predicted dehydrogenase
MKADRITRRRFLETLPAVVGPCVLAASVRGAEDAPPPSEQIAVGLLGCEKRFAWWQWEDYSGGQTTDHGAHDFDIVQWGLDMDGSGPVEIIPPHGNAQSPLTLRYASGVVVHSGRQGWQQRWSLVAFKGTKGTVSVWRGGIETRPTQLAATQSYSSA